MIRRRCCPSSQEDLTHPQLPLCASLDSPAPKPHPQPYGQRSRAATASLCPGQTDSDRAGPPSAPGEHFGSPCPRPAQGPASRALREKARDRVQMGAVDRRKVPGQFTVVAHSKTYSNRPSTLCDRPPNRPAQPPRSQDCPGTKQPRWVKVPAPNPGPDFKLS